MSSATVMERVAAPGPTDSSVIPSPWLARSSAHITSALRRATSSGLMDATLARRRLPLVGRGVQEQVADLREPVLDHVVDLVGRSLDLFGGQVVRQVDARGHEHL